MNRKFNLLKLFLFSLIFALLSCGGVTPCDCSTEFGDAERWPTQADQEKIRECMKLYFKEKGRPNNPNWGSPDYVAAHYHFTNHPCHSSN
jgi:hypothetical protein